MKKCSNCWKMKPKSSYHPSKLRARRQMSICKSCCAELEGTSYCNECASHLPLSAFSPSRLYQCRQCHKAGMNKTAEIKRQKAEDAQQSPTLLAILKKRSNV